MPLVLLLAIPLLTAAPAAQEEPGFEALFDGQTLTGWTTTGGRYDGAARWAVEDGNIVGRQGENGAGGLLYTERSYASFEVRLDVKLDQPFDSGVFLRMAPEGKGAQVTLDWREGGEIGAIYSDGFLQHNEGGAARFKKDEWNDVRVRCTGFDMRIEVWLNGDKLTDFAFPAGSPGYASTGKIGLQVHGEREDTGAARFRNLRVRELPLFGQETFTETANGLLALTEHAQRLGWRALFDGSSLEGWELEGAPASVRAAEGVLEFLAQDGGGHLATREDFTDFCLRFDFRIARMANSGVFLRAARDGSNPAFSGSELQILDDFHWESVTGSTLQPWQFTGGLYGAVAPGDRSALLPLGEWNSYEILFQGARLAVALNGRTLYDVDTSTLTPASGPPFAQRAATGFIGLQHHGSEHVEDAVMASFRNLFVLKLP